MASDLNTKGQQEPKPTESTTSSHSTAAERTINTSDLRLQRLLETDAVGILFFEATTSILVNANDVFLRLFGYTREQVDSRQLTWRSITIVRADLFCGLLTSWLALECFQASFFRLQNFVQFTNQ